MLLLLISSFRLALISLSLNKGRSLLTILGIVIGTSSVILLVAIGNGLQSVVNEQFASLGSNLIFVVPGKINIRQGPGRPPTFTPKFSFTDVRNLTRLGGPIISASGLINKNSTAKYGPNSYDVTLNGIDENYGLIRSTKAQSGRFIEKNMVEGSQSVVVIGPNVVKNLFTHGEDPLSKEITLSNQRFTVIGITESKGGGFGGGSDQDSFVFVPLTTAQKYLGEKNPGSIIVQVVSGAETPVASEIVKRYFNKRGLTEDDFTVLEPKEILSTVNSFLGAITAALGGIASISLLVGGIGIMNIMLVTVTERTKEIGLRKALGAKPGDILLQFLTEAIVLSSLGGLLGIFLGFLGSLALSRVFTTRVTAWSVFLSFSFSALVGIIFGILPAFRASKLNPIEALRYE